jgi:small-conductance mechanosensitive channel
MNVEMHIGALVAAIVQQDTLSGGVARYELTGLTSDTQIQILLSVLGVALVFLARWALLVAARARVDDVAVQYRWTKVSRYVALVLALLVLLLVWFTAIRGLGTFLGLLSAGLAIALKDLVADFAG